jgi:hypothetical protein
MDRAERQAVRGLSLLYGLRLLGMYMVLPVLALHAAKLDGATPFLIGLSVGCYGLAQGVLQVPLGALRRAFVVLAHGHPALSRRHLRRRGRAEADRSLALE